MMNDINEKLKRKFNPNTWTGHLAFRYYKYTGLNLINEINDLDPDLVIDAGCGHNRYKGHIKNLIGFDPQPFPFADIISNIEDINFRPESADVVMALGSIQFGDREYIESQVERITSWVKPGGFIVMRTMGEWFRDKEYPHKDTHYIWTRADAREIGEKNNLTIVKGIYEESIKTAFGDPLSTRNVWWWQKPGERLKSHIDPVSVDLAKVPYEQKDN
jgi:hypothetical protein